MKASIARWLGLVLVALALPAAAQEPPECLSTDAALWPAPAVPYVLVVADSTTSMSTAVGSSTSCGVPNATRRDHLTCALNQVLRSYSGSIHFGLAHYAVQPAANCLSATCFAGEPGVCMGCGPATAGQPATRRGLNIRVPVYRDAIATGTADPRNIPQLEPLLDVSCTAGDGIPVAGSGGAGSLAGTPINGALRDAHRYFQSSWAHPSGTPTFATPIGASDRICRRLHVVLIADGDESCDGQAQAEAAAAALFAGVTVNGVTYPVRVHVIAFAGGSAALDAVAAAGGTTAALSATNETQLIAALNQILTPMVAPEPCNNLDDNCNRCTDEGYAHYAHIGQSCCAWVNAPQRQTCLTNFAASITPANPLGNTSLLPCTTLPQAQQPATWLCANPGEVCDNLDNNGNGQVDEGQVRCGNPAHCPQAEVCNGEDDNCNGVIDEGNVCPGGGSPTLEVCDGCDNDFDGIADDNVAGPFPCGPPPGPGIPAQCLGTQACRPPQPVPPGQCSPSGGFALCSNSPQAETCNNLDDDCNGVADDGLAPAPCEPAGTPPGLVYGGTSQCRRGSTECRNGSIVCAGFRGPSPEITDGLDNDCDGVAEPFVLPDGMFADGFES